MTKKMKDSGVEWIGEIPEDWEVQNLKSILEERNEMNNPIKTESILSLTNDRGVIPYSEKGDIGNKSKEDLTKYKLVYPNDIVVNSMNVIIGSVGLSDYFGATSPVYYMLYPRNYRDSVKYYTYLFQTKEFQSKLVGYGNGIMEHRMRIPMLNLNKVHLPYPKSFEQKSIADFLDAKTQEIDNIISKTKKAIEEYKKYKQSLITETVTKGLDKNVEMKDSGIEWIGEIPEHWDVVRLKYLIKGSLKYGANSSGCSFNENLPRYIRITDISKENELKYTDKLSIDLKENSEFILKDKDILFARSGATVGKTFLYKEQMGLSAFAGYLIRARIDSNNLSEFVYYITLSSYYEKWKDSILIQATIENIGADKYNNLIITVPPVEEQKEIIRFLNKKTNQIDQIISSKEKLLREIEAYKKSLIYETVTGKREVE